MQMAVNHRRLHAVVISVTLTLIGCGTSRRDAIGLRDALAQEANRIRLLSEISGTVEFVPSTERYWVALVPPDAWPSGLTRPVSLTSDNDDRLRSCEDDAMTPRVLVSDPHGVECVTNEDVDVKAFQSVRKDKNEPVRIFLARDAGGVHVVSVR